MILFFANDILMVYTNPVNGIYYDIPNKSLTLDNLEVSIFSSYKYLMTILGYINLPTVRIIC